MPSGVVTGAKYGPRSIDHAGQAIAGQERSISGDRIVEAEPDAPVARPLRARDERRVVSMEAPRVVHLDDDRRTHLEQRQLAGGGPSDGTLRALGILLSLFQTGNGKRITLVGMEEPEIALHPAAAGILLDALREASRESQIVVTSHSPDLLDITDLASESILAVNKEKGDTEIASIDQASVAMLRQGLYTPGELLRLGQLEPDTQLFGENTRQLSLFDVGPV